jgi:hypothetical protein
MSKIKVLVVFACVLLVAATLAHACPTCGKAVEVLPPGQADTGMRTGFNASVYVLLASVIGAMGIVGRLIYKSSK